jgi:hypothetical protein
LTGRHAEAQANLTAAEAALPPGFHMPHVLALQAACNLELCDGKPAAAAARLDAAWANIDKSGVLRIQQMRIELDLLRARVALADGGRPLEERLKVVRGVADGMLKEGADWASGLGQLLRATAQGLRGDREAAAMTLLAAEEHLQTAGMRGWLQVARVRRGQLERGDGAARIAEAQKTLSELGAADPAATAAFLAAWPA